MTSDSEEEEIMEEIKTSENSSPKNIGSDQEESCERISVRPHNPQRDRKPVENAPRLLSRPSLSLKRNEPDEKTKKYQSGPPSKVR